MPYLFVGRLELRGPADKEYVAVVLPRDLVESYKYIFAAHIHILTKRDLRETPLAWAMIYVGRLFNEDGEVVMGINSITTANVKYCPSLYPHGVVHVEYCIDLTEVAEKLKLPLNYYLEILLFTLTVGTDSLEQREYVVYPHGFKYNLIGAPDRVRVFVEFYASSLKRVAALLELPIVLAKIGLEGLSADLVEGLERFYGGDYEGSIKFFRKVVEGLRSYVEKGRVFGGNRDGLFRDYLSKAFQLISNFGEHAGTRGLVYEAEFSMEICLSAVKYLSRYLLPKPPGEMSGGVPRSRHAPPRDK